MTLANPTNLLPSSIPTPAAPCSPWEILEGFLFFLMFSLEKAVGC